MRADQFRTTVSVDGRDLGIFDTKTGGETDSEESRYKPGGGPEEALGGYATVTNITVSRRFKIGRDDILIGWLRSRAGKGSAVIKVLNVDEDGNPWETSERFTGVLKRVSPAEYDSQNTEAAVFELEITPNGEVA